MNRNIIIEDYMSSKDYYGISGIDLIVYAALKAYMDENGNCYIHPKHLSSRIGVSTAKVWNSIKNLHNNGFALKRKYVYCDQLGKEHTAQYFELQGEPFDGYVGEDE